MNDETKSRVGKFERRQLLKGTAAAIGAVALPFGAKAQGKYTGLDVDFCRQLAAAVFGDANKVKFVPLTDGNVMIGVAATLEATLMVPLLSKDVSQ